MRIRQSNRPRIRWLLSCWPHQFRRDWHATGDNGFLYDIRVLDRFDDCGITDSDNLWEYSYGPRELHARLAGDGRLRW